MIPTRLSFLVASTFEATSDPNLGEQSRASHSQKFRDEYELFSGSVSKYGFQNNGGDVSAEDSMRGGRLSHGAESIGKEQPSRARVAPSAYTNRNIIGQASTAQTTCGVSRMIIIRSNVAITGRP